MANRYIKVAVKKKIIKVSRELCEYCKSPKSIGTDLFAIDHILPISLGGKSNFENLAFSCGSCNSKKFTQTTGFDEIENRQVRLFHPRKQLWEEHFKWNDDYTKLIGLSDVGRVTIKILDLNRARIVKLRTALIAIEEHPPK